MHQTLGRSAFVSLALAAMVLRALLPDGWMPSGQQGSPFAMCSVDVAPHGGKVPGAPDQERTHGPCAFAAAAPLAPPALSALSLGSHVIALSIVARFASDRIVSASHHQPNAARAPPSFA